MEFFSRITLAVIVAQATIVTAVDHHEEKYDMMKTVHSTLEAFQLLGTMKTEDKVAGDDVERHLAGSTAAKWKKKYEECKSEQALSNWLYVQMGNHCTLTKKGENKYTFSSSDMAPTTWAFQDRPLHSVDEMKTVDFVNAFDEEFTKETGGKPNAAMTFVHEDDNAFDGPLVSAIVDSSKEKDEDGVRTITYKLRQSKDQVEAYSLDEFFADDETEVNFVDCSIFIDGGSNGCATYNKNKERCEKLKFGVQVCKWKGGGVCVMTKEGCAQQRVGNCDRNPDCYWVPSTTGPKKKSGKCLPSK